MIWLFRTDKIGDTVLSLPLDAALQGEAFTWFLDSSTQFLAQHSIPERNSQPLPKFWDLIRQARADKPKAAVVLHSKWWVSLALWLGGVPVRAGRLSQWHSFLFFNAGIRQQRSLSEKHETDYGFELIRAAFPKVLPNFQIPALKLKQPQRTQVFEKWNLSPNSYYVIHAGMAGSARNWPEKNYVSLIQQLIEGQTVVLTGTSADAPYLTLLESEFKNHPRVRWTVGALSMNDLLAILARSKGVLAPSTGVLHLAASLGAPALGIYSPVRVQHPRRWGPRGGKAAYVVPAVQCPAVHSCLKEKCPLWDCMETLSVEQIRKSLTDLNQEA